MCIRRVRGLLLRTVIVLFLVSFCVLTWFAPALRMLGDEKRIVRRLEAAGISFFLDYGLGSYAPPDISDGVRFELLQFVFGKERVFRPRTAVIDGACIKQFIPPDLNRDLARLKGLTQVIMKDIEVPGEFVDKLSENTRIRQLRLLRCSASTEALNAIGQHNGLEAITVIGGSGYEGNLAFLTKLGKLKWLILSHTAVDFKLLNGLPSRGSVTLLSLESAKCDGSFRFLTEYMSLKHLDLSRTNFRSGDVRYLIALKRLESVYLAACEITDADLELLKDMEHLKELDVRGTAATSIGANALMLSRPNCRVYFDPISIGSSVTTP